MWKRASRILIKIKKDDIVIVFYFFKSSTEAKIILDYKKEARYKIILFTSRLYHNNEDSGDINIFVYRGNRNEYHFLTAPIVMVDAMIVKVTELRGKESLENLEKIKDLNTRYKNTK